MIRQRLFVEDNLTFDQAVKLACALEAAERDASAVELSAEGAGAHAGGGVQEAGAVHALAPWPRGGGRSARGPGAPGAAQAAHCQACGAKNHVFKDCRFKKAVCSKCGKEGHLRRVCSDWAENAGRTYNRSSGGGYSKGNNNGRRAFHHLKAEDTSDQEESENDFSEEENLNQLSLSGYRPT
ncbi:cold shock domain-containing protein 3-like [Plutella xylostella]|nr:cold shock domain-containing protein 3-like [Plutella xylostella]